MQKRLMNFHQAFLHKQLSVKQLAPRHFFMEELQKNHYL